MLRGNGRPACIRPAACDTDLDGAIASIEEAIKDHEAISDVPRVLVGVHDFTYGGIVLGARYWVPSKRYFELRYKINQDVLKALRETGVQLLSVHGIAMAAHPLSADEEEVEEAEG